MNNVKVTCIAENTISFKHSLLTSHGQSLFIEIDDKKYLFDTSEIYEGFTYNLENLAINFDDIDTVVLSHNHLDHSGALFKLVDDFNEQKLLLPPDMLSLQESKYNSRYRRDDKETAIKKLLEYKNTKIINAGMQINEGIYTTGSLTAEVQEQSLILDIPDKGLVILVGCAHPTLPVIVEKAKEVTGINKIYGIVGGLHYGRLNDEEIVKNVAYIQSLDPEFIIPSHCTGYKASVAMQQVLGNKVHVSLIGGQFGTGNSFTILPELSFNLS